MDRTIAETSKTRTDVPNTTVALRDAVHGFVQHCRLSKSLSPHSLRAYQSDLNDFLEHAKSIELPGDVDAQSITDYVHSMRHVRRLKETTIRRHLATLKVLFRWFERENIIPVNVFHRMDLSTRLPKRLPRALESGEMRRLLQASSYLPRKGRGLTYGELLMNAVLVIFFSTGVRVGELVSICLADVSLAESSILIRGKGNRERRVYIAGRGAMCAVKRFWLKRRQLAGTDDHLFLGQQGKPVSPQLIRARLGSLAHRAGVAKHVTPHMLRHTAATQLLDAGVDIRFVQKLLGHSSIATTQIYTQVSDVMLKAKLDCANTLGRVRRAG